MTTKDTDFVGWMRKSFGVKKVDEIKREDVDMIHIKKVLEFLSPEAEKMIAILSHEADVNKQAVHMSAENPDFIESGLEEITGCARTIICRIFGSQGREIEFSEDGIIVSPHRKYLKQSQLQSA